MTRPAQPARPAQAARIILFDLDGTLIDSQPDISAAFVEAASQLRPGKEIRPELLRPLIGRPLGVMAGALGLRLSQDEERTFESAYRARFDVLDCLHARMYHGMAELLAELDAEGESVLAVVTGKIQYQASHVVQRMGLAPRFRHVQGWREGLAAKPAPDLIESALEALGAGRPAAGTRSDFVYVGDAPTDVEAAHAAGIDAIAVSWGYGDRDALEAAAPRGIAESPGDLRRLLRG